MTCKVSAPAWMVATLREAGAIDADGFFIAPTEPLPEHLYPDPTKSIAIEKGRRCADCGAVISPSARGVCRPRYLGHATKKSADDESEARRVEASKRRAARKEDARLRRIAHRELISRLRGERDRARREAREKIVGEARGKREKFFAKKKALANARKEAYSQRRAEETAKGKLARQLASDEAWKQRTAANDLRRRASEIVEVPKERVSAVELPKGPVLEPSSIRPLTKEELMTGRTRRKTR